MRRNILASASPRRKEILEQIGFTFEILPSTKEEIVTKILPSEMVEELSLQKAMDIVSKVETEEAVLVIGADTLVAYGNKVMGKPKNEIEAMEMISLLQGNTHQVYTGVTLWIKKGEKVQIRTFHEKTDVVMYPIEEAKIREYIATKEPMDKAGAYAIQGLFAVNIKEIHGDYNNVVGFPVARVIWELNQLEKEME